MSIASQESVISMALQAGMYGKNGTFDPTDLSWVKFHTPRVSAGPIQMQPVFPLELGGGMTPTGAYKQMAFFAGDFDLIPRLEGYLGWLLYAVMGAAAYSANTYYDGTTPTGINRHRFTHNTSQQSRLPFMAMRKLMPGRIASEQSGETGFDGVIDQIRIMIPASGKLAMAVTFKGRDTIFSNDPLNSGSWTYLNSTFENSSSTPDAGRGFIKIGGKEYAIMNCMIEINNNTTSPQDEMNVGSFHPDSFIALTKNVTIRFLSRYKNDDLHRQIYTGAPESETWSSLPSISDSVVGTPAFEAVFLSPTNIGSTGLPYAFRFFADRVTLAEDAPPELQAGGFITQPITATVLAPDTGDYFALELYNAAAASLYTPPQGFTGTAIAATLSYTAVDSTPTLLDAAATFATIFGDSSLIDGKINVWFGTPSAGTISNLHTLLLSTASGDFSISGQNITHVATSKVVGTFYTVGNGAGVRMSIEFNANMTPAILQDLLQNLAYAVTTGSNSTTVVPVNIRIQDGSGNTYTDTITITHA